MARRMRRLQARRSGSSLRRASSRMEQAEQLLQENQSNQAEAEQQEVLDDLKQAERELAEEERQAEEQLAREMLERIGDELKSMIAREQTVIEETNRLEALRRQRGNWSRAQLKDAPRSGRGAAGSENGNRRPGGSRQSRRGVCAGAQRSGPRDGVRREALGRSPDRRRNRRPRIRRQESLHRFGRGLGTRQAPENRRTASPGRRRRTATNNAGPQSEAIPHIAQLKMLKTLQEDLIRRTETLDRLRKETRRSPTIKNWNSISWPASRGSLRTSCETSRPNSRRRSKPSRNNPLPKRNQSRNPNPNPNQRKPPARFLPWKMISTKIWIWTTSFRNPNPKTRQTRKHPECRRSFELVRLSRPNRTEENEDR